MIQLVSCEMEHPAPLELNIKGRNVKVQGVRGVKVNLTLEMYDIPQIENILEEIAVDYLVQTHGEDAVKELYPERFI